MNSSLPRRRSPAYLFLVPALALCICLQIIISALQPQSLLAVLAALFRAPGYASYPFSLPIQVTLLSSSGALYAGTVPNSFVLRAGNGTVVQKVPESIFATYKGILYTSAFTSNPQVSTTLVKAIRESDGNVLWTHSFTSLNSIQLIDGILYTTQYDMVPQQEVLQAIDPSDGHLLWQYECSSQGCYINTPQVGHGIAYTMELAGSVKSLLALRTSDGSRLWQVAMYQYASQPFLATDRLLVQTASNTFTAYSALDGRILWHIQIPTSRIAEVVRTISNGATGIISTPTTLYAFRMDSGAPLWQRQDSPLNMLLDTATLYLSEPTGLIALNATSGQQLWQQAFPAWAIKNAQAVRNNQGNPVLGVSNGIVYMWLKGLQNGFGLEDGVFAYHIADGQLVWQHRFTLPSTPEMSAPGEQTFIAGSDMEALLDGNAVYFTEYEAVTTVYPVHFTIDISSVLASFFNMTTFILSSQALDGQTGSVRWQNQQVEQFHVA